MTLTDSVKILAKAGAILAIVLGFLTMGLNGLEIIQDLVGLRGTSPANLVAFSFGLVAAILGFIILGKYLAEIDSDPKTAAVNLIIFGVIAALGSYIVGGLLVFVAGLLLVLEHNKAT